MNVLILYTLPPDRAEGGRSVDEFDLTEAARGVAAVLPEAAVAGVRGEVREVLAALARHRPDVIFNLCEAPLGQPALEAAIAGVFEWLGIRFTGSRTETLALCRRKDWTGAVLTAAGVAVPRTGVFPCVVKPADEDGSAGIGHESLCADQAAVDRARPRWPGRVVVQEFLPGREFAVSLWGRTEPEAVSIGEFTFQNGLRMNTYASKWDEASADFANSPLSYTTAIDAGLRATLADTARAAWRAAGIRGYARLDLRVDSGGTPRVLDVNPNPELAPGVGIHRAVEEAGWTWAAFVAQQLEWAC